MANYTIFYGDLVDRGIITNADLPPAWAAFPATVMPNNTSVDFYALFYERFQHREIGGETIPAFLASLRAVTFETLEMLPSGIYHNLLGAAVTVESDETRQREYLAAPNGVIDNASGFTLGGEREVITRKREYESELERAEHLLSDGKPLNVWICDRFEKCFLGVF